MTGACMKKNRNFVPKNSLTGTASKMAADFYRNKKGTVYAGALPLEGHDSFSL